MAKFKGPLIVTTQPTMIIGGNNELFIYPEITIGGSVLKRVSIPGELAHDKFCSCVRNRTDCEYSFKTYKPLLFAAPIALILPTALTGASTFGFFGGALGALMFFFGIYLESPTMNSNGFLQEIRFIGLFRKN